METTTSRLINMASENNNGLLVSGELFISGCSLFGTEVTLFENNQISQKYICCLNGFFYFKLDYEKNYTIMVAKDGYEVKTIVFNTELKGFTPKKRFYEFGVSLKPIGSNTYDNNAPSAIVKYAIKSGEFEHDKNYQQQLQNKVA